MMRFVKNDPAKVYVSGSPLAYGNPIPAYGARTVGGEETSIRFSAPTAWTNAAETLVVSLTGCKVYSRDADTNARQLVRELSLSDLDNGGFDFEPDGTCAEVEWQWHSDGERPAVAASEGGSVQWSGAFAASGTEYELTAVPAAGYRFGYWSGSVPENADAFCATLKITADGGTASVRANFQREIYVSVDGDDGRDGTSWETALATVQAALGKAEDPCVIVGPGVHSYANRIVIEKPTTVVGVTANGGTESVMRLTATQGALFVLSNDFAVVRNLAMTTRGSAYGRGVLIYGHGTVDGCVITNVICDYSKNNFGNNVPNDGGGVMILGSGTVRNTYFNNCYCLAASGDYRGGAIAFFGGGLAENCEIRNCYAKQQGGGGVYLKNGGTLRNSLISECYMTTAQKATAIDMSGGSVENCTIADNYMLTSSTATVIEMSGGHIVNSIIWGNVNGSGVSGMTKSGGIIEHCTADFPIDGPGNVMIDPQFTDAEHGDYTIGLSEIVDTGVQLGWHAGARDLAGNARVSGEAVDPGCYEFAADGLVVSLSSESDGRNDSSDVSFIAQVLGTTMATQAYSWHVTSEAGYDVSRTEAGLSTLTLTLPAGLYSAEVTVRDGNTEESATISGVYVKASHTYVSKNGSNVAPYTNAVDAASEIADALEYTGAGGIVHVADGFYTMADTLKINSSVRVKGDNGPERVSIHTEPSIKGMPMVLFGHSGAVLDGVTISGWNEARNKQPPVCCAVRLDAKGGTVTNCVIDGLTYDTAPGGVGAQMSNGLIVDTIIRNCTSPCVNVSRDGIGISMSGGTVDRCLITGNNTVKHGSSRGGGVYMTGGTLSNSIISFNECSGNGGGVYNTEGKVVNCLIYGNIGWKNGTGIAQNGKGKLINLTVTGNHTNQDDTVVACYVAGKGTVKNCIVWGNEGAAEQISTPASGSTMDHNCTTDPHFRNASGFNFQLSSASSNCIDKGDDSAWEDLANAKDILGKSRKIHKHVDIGCYERDVNGLMLLMR